MQKCPHCQRDGISNLQKAISVSFSPATCTFCNGQSYTHIIYGLLALTTWIVITWVFIGLSYFSRSSFFLLGTVPAMVLAVNKYLLESPLIAIKKK